MGFQLGAALLEAVVLAIVSKEDAYGYSLTQQVKEVMDISESTLYPVLRRLQKNGDLTTYDVPYEGRNRRYYKITDQGMENFNTYFKEWQDYKALIDRVLEGGVRNG